MRWFAACDFADGGAWLDGCFLTQISQIAQLARPWPAEFLSPFLEAGVTDLDLAADPFNLRTLLRLLRMLHCGRNLLFRQPTRPQGMVLPYKVNHAAIFTSVVSQFPV
jgi:hypothetical protein